MNEVKKVLKRLAFYYLLLIASGILPFKYIFSDRFPTRNFSTIYLFILCTGLLLYYSYRVARPGRLKVMMNAVLWMILLLIILRGIKYSVFAEVDVLKRYTWYLYYVPMLLIPLFTFYMSLLISTNEEQHVPQKYHLMLIVTVILILIVLTNDFHQHVFRFNPGFENWDEDYSYGWGHFAVTVWESLLYFLSVTIMIIKCRVGSSKKNAWLILLPFVTGIIMIVLITTGNMPELKYGNAVEYPEVLCFMVAGVLECCIQLGPIPMNEGYRKLLMVSSISLQITDRSGTPVYKSATAADLTWEQFSAPDGTRIGEHSMLHRIEIPGGFGFWQDDVSEPDRLNAELTEIKKRLSEEVELTRLQNELREKQAKIEQRTLVYDKIAECTQSTSQLISHLAAEARSSSDRAFKDKSRKHIVLLGAYIKRYANLMLISEDSKIIGVGELALSFAEMLRYLNICGIPAEMLNNAQGSVSVDAALTVFEAFRTLLEMNLYSLRGVFVNFSGCSGAILKLTLENLRASFTESVEEKLSLVGVKTLLEYEDNVTYICLTLPAGGAAV
jgi:CDP-diglyceride synthetase